MKSFVILKGVIKPCQRVTAATLATTVLASFLALSFDARAAVTTVAFWHFGEIDPGVANDVPASSTFNLFGDPMPLSGNPTYTSDVSARGTAQPGSTFGLHFNGASYGTNALVSPLTDNFGVELWVKPDSADGDQCLAYNGHTGANGWGLYISGGQFQALLGGVSLFPGSGAPAMTNVWTHLALVRDNGTNAFFVNGVRIATNTFAPNLPTGGFAVAAAPQLPTLDRFSGALDEVRVFSFAPGGFSAHDLQYGTQPDAGFALDFDGVNDFFSATLTSPPASNYTLSAWVYLRMGGTLNGTRMALLSTPTCGASIEFLIRAQTENPLDPQYLELGRCGSFTGVPSTRPVPLNTWTHVAVTVTSGNTVTYYINGTPAGTWIIGLDFSFGSTIHLGANTGARRFDGQLDEVQLWNRALPADEILNQWSRSLAGNEPGLLSYYRFDTGTSIYEFDSAPAGGQVNGFLGNGTQWVPSGMPMAPPATLAHAGNLTDLGAGWRSDSPAKPLDLDSDNILGTDGYVLVNLPSALPSYLASANILTSTYPGNDDYSSVDDPTSPGNQFLAGTMNPSPGPGGSADLFNFTLNAGAVGRTIRVGLLVDNLDGAVWNAASLTLVQTNGTRASNGPVATVAPALNNRIPDWIFFDISGGQPGDAFVIRGTGGVNGAATLGGVAFDSAGPVGRSVATSPLGSASPYPSRLTVPALAPGQYNLTLTVSNVTCPWQGMSLLLVGPGGQKVRPMSYAFGTFDNLNGPTVLTFDDFAAASLPVLAEGAIPSGRYRPDSDQSWPDLAAPAPPGPYPGTFASAVTGQLAGVWSLYVAGSSVSLSSWSLTFVPITTPVVVTGSPTDVANYAATLHGTVNPGNLPTTAWFEYGPGTGYGSLTPPQSLPATNATLAFTALLTNLPGGTSSYRLVASNHLGIVYGNPQTFSFAGFSHEPVNPNPLSLGSIAWGDYDNDGRQDFLSVGSFGGEATSEIWRNTGSGFTNVTTNVAVGLPGVGKGTGAWGDYDNDGRLDILIAGRTGTFELEGPPITQVWRNTGNGFTNVPIPGLPGISGSATWGDFDNDGRLDFVLVGLTATSNSTVQFWRNTGSGFTPVVGNVSNPAQIVAVGERTRVIVGDFDRNGWLDFLAAGDAPTRFWFNYGGVFTVQPGISGFLPSFFHGAAPTGDFDNDGWLDFHFSGDAAATFILRNLGTPLATQKFSPISPPVFAGYSFSTSAWGDSDNDGKLDLLITGRTNNITGELGVQLLRNTGNDFLDVTSSEVPGLPASTLGSIAWSDYDNDGRLDFLYTGAGIGPAQLWRNHTPVTNTPPGVPAGLTATTATNGIMLRWAPASDAQTPTATLSYNVRIGTTPGGTDILSPAAAANGWRRVTALGNAQTRTNFLITHLLPGTYYWNVQAVDNGFAGGPFAAEASFTIAPRLEIVAAGTNVVLSWPALPPEWVLQESPSLSPAAWTTSPSGPTNPITLPATNGAKIYRLTKP